MGMYRLYTNGSQWMYRFHTKCGSQCVSIGYSMCELEAQAYDLCLHQFVMFDSYRMGKTTLLNHIAERKLAIPPRIDVLLCEQEVVADDTPAIDAVLKADTKRLELLEEEKKLVAEGEAGDDSHSDRLKEVRWF